MSSYYPSFNYMGVNSRDKRLIVAHFDADQGESETFMGMEPIYTESADGSRRLDYGAKYNSVAVFRITVIKEDGGDFSVKEVREHLKWLTGSKKNSPLDLCENFIEEFVGDGATSNFKFVNTCDYVVRTYVDGILLNDNQWTFDRTNNTIQLVDAPINGAIIKVAYSRIKYSFIGRITNAWQYKLDARTSGIILEFTSVSPWAYSAKQVVYLSMNKETTLTISNDTDDLYSYTPVNVVFDNISRNLLLKSGVQIESDKYRVASYTPISPLVEGEKYTISMCVTPADGVKQLTVHASDGMGIITALNVTGNNKQVIYKTFEMHYYPDLTPDVNIRYSDICLYRQPDDGSVVGTTTVHWVQIEKGDTPTTWLPVAEDNSFQRTLSITNDTIGETTEITKINANEIITLSDNMMITSNNASKVFGNSFNFVFPRLVAGKNNITINGMGNITFEYRHALKVGDCAMDISVDTDPICAETGEIILVETLPFSRISELPDNFQAYNIQNVYSKTEVDTLIANIKVNESIQIDEDELKAMLEEELLS